MKRNDAHFKADDGKNSKAGNDFLSLAINITGRRCLVVGGGNIGSRKAATLLAAGAAITIVSPQISSDLLETVEVNDRIAWLPREYRSNDLHGTFLVVAATSDSSLNSSIAVEAEKRGILCCAVSSSADSTVLFPAVHIADGITIAVSSNGQDCRRSKRICDELSRRLESDTSLHATQGGYRQGIIHVGNEAAK